MYFRFTRSRGVVVDSPGRRQKKRMLISGWNVQVHSFFKVYCECSMYSYSSLSREGNVLSGTDGVIELFWGTTWQNEKPECHLLKSTTVLFSWRLYINADESTHTVTFRERQINLHNRLYCHFPAYNVKLHFETCPKSRSRKPDFRDVLGELPRRVKMAYFSAQLYSSRRVVCCLAGFLAT